ncbi:MAG: hypothetical protein U5L03_12260 [Burkholderiaceae bacterium]|nr:hypothetical protein [Burkholderiaceae bacterium]
MLHLWRTQPAERIAFDDIYQLDGYSCRIEGIGAAKPIYVPLLQRPVSEDEGKPGSAPGGPYSDGQGDPRWSRGSIVIPLSHAWLDDFEKQVDTG